MQPPDLLALDFDGVICDGLQEYFQTAWQAYGRAWRIAEIATKITPPQGLAEQFYRLRPVIETGWEMPVLIAGLVQGVDEAAILADWPQVRQAILENEREYGGENERQDPRQLAQQVDGERDRQIQTNLDQWLALHRFYPGVLGQLQAIQASSTQLFIVSTKEGRFIQQLLAEAGVALDPAQIIGKAIKQPKYQTLRDLKAQFNAQEGRNPSLWFVEDRLEALRGVQAQEDLQEVRLFLVDWGYNLEGDRQAAQADSQISLLSLQRFTDPLEHW